MEFFYGIRYLVVKKNQIRRAALADASRLLHPVQLRRIQAHFLKQSQIINVTSFYQPGNRQWQGSSPMMPLGASVSGFAFSSALCGA